jgi:hypothetical protein
MQVTDVMGLLTALYIVFYEVKRHVFVMTVCGSDFQKRKNFLSPP